MGYRIPFAANLLCTTLHVFLVGMSHPVVRDLPIYTDALLMALTFRLGLMIFSIQEDELIV